MDESTSNTGSICAGSADKPFNFQDLPPELRIKIARDIITNDAVAGQIDFFTIRIVDNSITIVDGPNIALTSKTIMAEIFLGLGPDIRSKLQLDVSNSRPSNSVENTLAFISEHRFLESSIKNFAGPNLVIVGWHRPAFSALVNLCWVVGQNHGFKGDTPEFRFDEVGTGFACKFAISWVLDQMIRIGAPGTVSRERLQLYIWRQIKGPCFHHATGWDRMPFEYIAEPVCTNMEEIAARNLTTPEGCIHMFLGLMSRGFQMAGNSTVAMVEDGR